MVSSAVVGGLARQPAARAGRWTRAVPALVELLLVVAAIAALWPFFERIAPLAAGRERRFLERGIAVVGLPEAVLPSACDAVGAGAEAGVAAALCGSKRRASPRPASALPSAVTQAG